MMILTEAFELTPDSQVAIDKVNGAIWATSLVVIRIIEGHVDRFPIVLVSDQEISLGY
jgi:hypothetical protein